MITLSTRLLTAASFMTATLGATAAHAIDVTQVTFNGPGGVTLRGVLYTPDDFEGALDGAGEPTGPAYQHPAVVMMHGCTGIWSNRTPFAVNGDGTPNLQNHIEKWGLKLAAEGYVALAVDSYTPREPATVDTTKVEQRQDWQNQCKGTTNAGKVNPYTTRVEDARAAFAWLAADTVHIDDDRVGLMGWSQGAESTLVESADAGRDVPKVMRATSDRRFASAVAFYPGCGTDLGFGSATSGHWRPWVDLRLQVGTGDSFYTSCQNRVTRANAIKVTGSNLTYSFVGYAGAAHGFDQTAEEWPTAYCADANPTGDVCAMDAADIDSLEFFADHL